MGVPLILFMLTLEIKLKSGKISVEIDEAKELYEKLKTFFYPIKLQPEKFINLDTENKKTDFYV